MSSAALKPGLRLGPYPEREAPAPDWLERSGAHARRLWQRSALRGPRELRRAVHRVDRHTARLAAMSQPAISEFTLDLRRRLHREGLMPEVLGEAFALVREVAGRTLGQRHFDTQIMGGWVMANGMLAEMETGEGKTLTATLPTAAAALAGIPVHIMTANDYLVARDAEKLRPLYQALGLSVGHVTQDMSPEDRRQAYACDITYGTGKQIAFDYLRDRLLLARRPGRLHLQLGSLLDEAPITDQLLLRGLCFAIVDEADSILIDEARTPLLIAQQGRSEDQGRLYAQALELASRLQAGIHFDLDPGLRSIQVLPAGLRVLEGLAPHLKGAWLGERRRRELVTQALSALHLFHRDRDYLVKDDTVQIIDETTGRLMPDRSWERGLHQMIEAKEGCEASAQNETLARLSFQRFFRRYLRLAGMTGTAQEVAGELASVYGLNTVVVPTRRPVQRRNLGEDLYPTVDAKWAAVTEAVRVCHATERPVLVGTRSVAASEHLSTLLSAAGLPHEVINARQNEREAEIVAHAGEPGRITVATNMAGRGTDIPLTDASRAAGGLHVIAAERNESGRIDRQLFGRAARQGDPGSFQVVCALEDELCQTHLPVWLQRVLRRSRESARPLPPMLGRALIRSAQARAARLSRHERNDLLRLDQHLADTLAFAGRSE